MMSPTISGVTRLALATALVATVAVDAAAAPSRVVATAAIQLDSLTTTYEVAGVKVIHRPVATNDVVAVNLYLLGGIRQTRPTAAGIEPFMLYASEYGTKKYPGEAARRALAHTGSWIRVGATPDYSVIAFRGIRQEFDSTWAVFTDRVMQPTLDSAAMEIVRAQLLSSVKSDRESPRALAASIADSLAYESHPYAIPTLGSEASLKALTADDIRNYMSAQMMTSRMLLVVVGDVSRDRLEKAITSTLGTLPRGNYTWTLPDPWKATAPRVVAVHRKAPTNYIYGVFSGPQLSSPDYPPFRIATSFLGGLLSDAIRYEGLSYSAGAMTMDYGAAGGAIFVSTVRPDSVVKIINLAIDLIQQAPLERSSLLKHAKTYINSYYYQTESNAELAGLLATAQLYRGDFRAAATHADVLRKVTGGDVRRAAREYVKNIQYAFVGDTLKAPTKLMLKP